MSLWLISLALLAPGATDVSVETLDGTVRSGAITSFDTQSITLEKDGENNTLPIKRVAKLVQNSATNKNLDRATVWLELVDDTRLTATSYRVKDDEVDVRLTSGQQLRISRKHIRHVRMKSQDDTIASQWKKILSTDADADLLVIRKRGKIDFLEGVVGNIDAANVSFKFDGDLIPVKIEKVEGVIYHGRSVDDPPEANATFTSADGARLLAIEWKLGAKDSLTIKTPLGLTITLPLSTISRADLTAGKLVYLSDLEPTASKWTPYIGGGNEMPLLELMFRPRSDRAIDGGPLRLGGKDYRKGLSIHSRTEMTYNLKGKYRRFKALAGIDDRTRDRGHVEVVIKADDKVLFSGTFSGKDEPRQLDLDVTNARRLEILVDYGKDLDISDHMNLIDARILK
jgi:hypothetical protein